MPQWRHRGAAQTALSGPYAGYLVYDTFTDTNGTKVSAHVPEKAPGGSAWAEVDGSNQWTISSNRASNNSPADSTVQIDSGASDVDIVVASVIPGKYFAIIARGNGSPLNYVMAQIQTSEDVLNLAYHDGSYHVISSVAYTSTPGGEITNFEFKLSGTALSIWINGVQKLTGTSSFNQANTQIGLYGYTEDGTCSIDGLTVAAL